MKNYLSYFNRRLHKKKCYIKIQFYKQDEDRYFKNVFITQFLFYNISKKFSFQIYVAWQHILLSNLFKALPLCLLQPEIFTTKTRSSWDQKKIDWSIDPKWVSYFGLILRNYARRHQRCLIMQTVNSNRSRLTSGAKAN